ncbi:hypothetical protein AURDEDRAFT_115233 [Auricularia subglabra TFB-10046 SS5]|nr:hypothetical protein AURDEDRAFT_115233 [Auricularia subglabra TFB-10046 SS5]
MFVLKSIVLTVLAVAGLASGNNSGEPDCRTKFAGILSAPIFRSAYPTLKSFTLNSNKQIAYTGDGKSPLVVQFQACKSLRSVNLPDDPELAGRLFVPEKGKCVTVANADKARPPYFTTLAPCGTGVAQRFAVFPGQENGVYWLGKSNFSTGVFQGGCGSGVMGYLCDADGTPTLNHSNKQITLGCDGFKPFWWSMVAL